MKSNVLIIPNADFSNSAVESVFSLCNESYMGENLLGYQLNRFDASRAFIIGGSSSYQGKQICKIELASALETAINHDVVRIFKIKPKSSSEGMVVNKNDLVLLKKYAAKPSLGKIISIFFSEPVTLGSDSFLVIVVGHNKDLGDDLNATTSFGYANANGLFPMLLSTDEDQTVDFSTTQGSTAVGVFSIKAE